MILNCPHVLFLPIDSGLNVVVFCFHPVKCLPSNGGDFL